MRSPDEILDAAPKKSREVRIEANVVAYFGDLLMAWKKAATASATASGKGKKN